MPTYDYRCTSCGKTLELFQSITARPKKKCPLCGNLTMKRLIGTGGGIIFKGSGFYQTDYRSESYKRAAKAESDGASGGDKGDKNKTPDKKLSLKSESSSSISASAESKG